MRWACRGRTCGRWAEHERSRGRARPLVAGVRGHAAGSAPPSGGTASRRPPDKKEMAAALTGMCAVEAATAEEEAEAIALMLREAVETPGPDGHADHARSRAGAARGGATGGVGHRRRGRGGPAVRAERFPASLLDLVAAAAEKQFEPVALMTLLKHPLCRAGMAAGDMRRAHQHAGAGRLPRRPISARAWKGSRRRWRAQDPDPGGTRRSAASRTPTGRPPAICCSVWLPFSRPSRRPSPRPSLPACTSLRRLHFATAQALAKTERRR